MKISPIAGPSQGSGAAVGGPAVSQDRREAAKQAYLGNTGHSVTQSDVPVDERVLSDERNIRRIKMRTNVSPDRLEDSGLVAQTSESAIPDQGEPTIPESEVTRPISPQFAELAKQRRALQVKEREILAKEKALADRETSQPGLDLTAVKADPLGILRKAGVSYEELTEAVLSDSHNPELSALQAKIDALEKGMDTKLNERDSQAEQQVLREMRKDADALVAQRDEFKYVKAMGKNKDAVELVHRTWKQTGEVMDVEEALALVNAECKKDYDRMSGFLTPAQQAQQQQIQKTNQLRTLTNRNSAQAPMSPRARALAAFRGTLK